MVLGQCDESQMKDDRAKFIEEFDGIESDSRQIKGLYYSVERLFENARYAYYYVHRFDEDGNVVSMAITEVTEDERIRSKDEVVGLLANSSNQELTGEGSYLVKGDLIEIRLSDKKGQEALYWGEIDEKRMKLTVYKDAAEYCDGLYMDRYIRSGP